MAKKSKITVKQLIKGKKIVFEEGKDSTPIAIIGGMANRVFYRTTDAGSIPYLRGTFWYDCFLDNQRGVGEVCVLPVSLASEIIERLTNGASGVEFVYRVELRKRAKAQIWERIIDPRVDDVLSRLQNDVARILAVIDSDKGPSIGEGGGDGNAASDGEDSVVAGGDRVSAADPAGGGDTDQLPAETANGQADSSTEGDTAGADQQTADKTTTTKTSSKNRRLGGVAP